MEVEALLEPEKMAVGKAIGLDKLDAHTGKIRASKGQTCAALPCWFWLLIICNWC